MAIKKILACERYLLLGEISAGRKMQGQIIALNIRNNHEPTLTYVCGLLMMKPFHSFMRALSPSLRSVSSSNAWDDENEIVG
jgi:hypothetical protein